MKRTLVIIGVLAALLPVSAGAQTTSIFKTFFNQARQEMPRRLADDRITQYVMKEMTKWGDRGVLIYPSDVLAARTGNDFLLCNDKVTADGKTTLTFLQGGGLSGGAGCTEFQSAILSLVESEQDLQKLGNTLLTIANGSELAVADESHRPSAVGISTLLLTRVWSGTGSRILEWPSSANAPLQELEAALAQSTQLEEVIWRYHHGYFRDQREADAQLAAYGNELKPIFEKLATALNKISGDPKQVGKGEYVTPKLSIANVSLWARTDDLGLQWTIPDHWPRVGAIKPAGTYPTTNKFGEYLAYPFSYGGSWVPPNSTSFASPLCSRTAGKLGYLCRGVPEPKENCQTGGTDAITLTECETTVRSTASGPDICPDISTLFLDTGIGLGNPDRPDELNPKLSVADKARICSPETRILYKDEVLSHACYVALCVAQSLSGHTLVPGRNSVVANEMSSPFLGCMLPDPQLGLYAELTQMSPFALPPYIGHEATRDYESAYCNTVGLPPNALAGVCAYRENRRANSPLDLLGRTGASQAEELLGVAANQDTIRAQAALIGQRIALDQAMPIYTKQIRSLASIVQETANLLNELRSAPLTQTACPWTGPFPVVSSSSPASP